MYLYHVNIVYLFYSLNLIYYILHSYVYNKKYNRCFKINTTSEIKTILFDFYIIKLYTKKER